MRDRLIELIDRADEECKHSKDCKSCSGYGKGSQCMNYHIADYLLENGVIVPPCKVGDTVFAIINNEVMLCLVKHIEVYEGGQTVFWSHNIRMPSCQFGKTVFLTREEAEAALRKEDEGK